MENLKNVKELFKKFKEGRLSPSEAQELSSYIQADPEPADLLSVMEDQWNRADQATEHVPSERMLAALLQNLTDKDTSSPAGRNFSIIKILRPYLKYAALIIFTAGLTWFGKDLTSRRTAIADNVSADEANNEVFVPFGSKTRIVLPDGSEVTLNSGSYLRYPARFDSTLRVVYIQGEAYFDIKKDPRNPFIVKTNEITIKVLGTKFNVKSYSDEKTVETTLVSGSIEIYPNGMDEPDISRVYVLKPNQQAIFEKQTGDLAVSERAVNQVNQKIKPVHSFQIEKKIDVNPVIAWKDHRLLFRDQSFAELSRKLERWYDVDIEIQDEELAKAQFSGVFEQETIEQALDALRLATPFTYKMNKNRIDIIR